MKRARARTITHGGASPAKHGAVAMSTLESPRHPRGKGRALAAPARRLAVPLEAQEGGAQPHLTVNLGNPGGLLDTGRNRADNA